MGREGGEDEKGGFVYLVVRVGVGVRGDEVFYMNEQTDGRMDGWMYSHSHCSYGYLHTGCRVVCMYVWEGGMERRLEEEDEEEDERAVYFTLMHE